MNEKYKAFLTNLTVGAFVTALVYWLNTGRGYPLLHSLCNGFFVAAVMLLGVGGLKTVRNKGAFDVAGFGFSSVIKIALPFLGDNKEEDIHEYRERKAQERKGAGGLLAAGAVYMALSLLSLCLYYYM